MAKRENRLKPIEHERRQIENLKTLEPIATPPDLKSLSDGLIDLALAALDGVSVLESGHIIKKADLQQFADMVVHLQSLAQE
ncbi:MAG: hypothetical protein HY862_12515 [Chloroflexi bacterium]|nr:hypothetical protein [Chloroflexota bacterium]